MTRRSGLTLVEVLAALVLVASVISGVVVTQSRSLAQLRATRDLATASQLARELVTEWQLNAPLARSGEFAGKTGWSWTRSELPEDPLELPDVLRVQLNVFKVNLTGDRVEIVTLTWLEDLRDQDEVQDPT